MPKLVFIHNEPLSVADERDMGRKAQKLVLLAINARGNLTEDDVDFVPQRKEPGCLIAAPVAFELETFGFPERKAALNLNAEALKEGLYNLLPETVRARWPLEHSLLWIKYVDPDGAHL